MHQPLYSMSAGELGETASEVEESLELVLELTAKWNSILLLDECDMFLEARTTADIRRNRLISSKSLVPTICGDNHLQFQFSSESSNTTAV
jgi:hypothetical protein